MKSLVSHYIILLTLLLTVCSGAFAQGGFGHFSFGPAIGSYSRLQRDLQQYHLLGPDFALSTTGISVGGGGMAVFDNGLLMGGNGFANFYGSGTSMRGETELMVAGGFFNFGYALHRQERLLLYPYAGFGAIGSMLELTNNSSNLITLDAHHTLDPGQTGEYSTGGLALEGGIGIKKLFTSGNNSSGYLIGLECGTFGVPSFQAWEYEGSNRKVTGLTSTRSQSFYVKLCFGGGRY